MTNSQVPQANLKLAEYLSTLDPILCQKYCQAVGLQFIEINPFTFTEASDVYDCLVMLLDNGIRLSCLFSKTEVWGIYLRGITEERYHTGIDLCLASGDVSNIIMYFRACYRFGFPAMDDTSFDVLEKFYIEAYPHLRFLTEQTYDDDEYNGIVMEAIRLSGVKNSGKKIVQVMNNNSSVTLNAEYEDLNTEKSTSIRPVVTEQEAFEFWRNAPICPVHFSLKIDGVNTKTLFSEGKGLEMALSRGRAADSIDYTDAIRTMLKLKGVKVEKLKGRVTGESFVGLKHLAIMQSRYPDKNYKTPKSTAMAMLRAPSNFLEEDYNYLSFLAFDYDGQKPDIAFKTLQEASLDVPPALTFNGEEIPRTSLADFNAWMQTNVLDPMWEAGTKLGIGSDGVVMYLLADINTERKDKYSDSNIAIKYSHWAAASYTSVVNEIIFEQRRVEASIVLGIEPVVMRDSNTATRVGVGSPDILINDGVRIGDTIEFERKSEAYNVYLRKK